MALGYLCKALTSRSADIIQQVWNDHEVSFMVPVKAHDSLTSAKSRLPWIHARGRKDTYIMPQWMANLDFVKRRSGQVEQRLAKAPHAGAQLFHGFVWRPRTTCLLTVEPRNVGVGSRWLRAERQVWKEPIEAHKSSLPQRLYPFIDKGRLCLAFLHLAFVLLVSLLPQVSSSTRDPLCTASLNGGRLSTSSGRC